MKGSLVTFILATHNRREVVLRTLDRIEQCGWADRQVIVVDNNCSDGTPDAVEPRVDTLIRLSRNRGSCAKTLGVPHAVGQYVVFLDDDSYPRVGSIERMVRHFEENDRLGAAGFSVHLPDGHMECGALPGVFVGCGVGLRADALRQCGGLDLSYFMQSEEYDLCFKLVAAGWSIDVFDDLHVEHEKTPQARRSARTTYFDIRNNLRVVARHLPPAYARPYRRDWIQRYRWLAQDAGHHWAFLRGRWAGRLRGLSDSKCRMTGSAAENFFRWGYIAARMRWLASRGARRIVLADLGKNVYAYYRGAEIAGLEVTAIADDRFVRPGRTYRGRPVVSTSDALATNSDAIVIANTAKVHAAATEQRLSTMTDVPLYHWVCDATTGVVKEAVGRQLSDKKTRQAIAVS